MIISGIWLQARTDRNDQFETDVTNLERGTLRYRFRYTLVQAHGTATDDMAHQLDDLVKLLAMDVNDLPHWTRSGPLFQLTVPAILIDPGMTRCMGLHTGGGPFGDDEMQGSGSTQRSVPWNPNFVLRGYWELSLPVLKIAGSDKGRTQLDHPARTLITVVHRSFSARRVTEHGVPREREFQSAMTLPLASGRAEHEIQPDRVFTFNPASPSAVPVQTRPLAKRKKPARRR